ncbi:MAG: hypothetical protein HQK51_15650 [Oligoflexia bacterium]|nr:hypothetical protein [Oligoflexia bacterium]
MPIDYDKLLSGKGPDKRAINETSINIKLQQTTSLSEKKRILRQAAIAATTNEEQDFNASTENQPFPSKEKTDNGRKIGGNWTDKKADNGRIMDGNWTDRSDAKNELDGNKTGNWTDDKADNGRIMDGNWTDLLAVADLSGLQYKITLLLFELIRSSRQKHTNPISLSTISETLSISKKSTKDAIYELNKKKVIRSFKTKKGRGGWAQYELADNIFNEILRSKTNEELKALDGNWTDNRRIMDGNKTDKWTDKRTDKLSSSSNNSIILNNTITTDCILNSDDAWLNIQTPDILRNLGFGKNVIDQVKDRAYFTPEKMQESLDNFAHDISNNKLLEKKPGISAIRYFMGAAKKSQVWISEGFKSPEDEAFDYLIKQKEQIFNQRKEKEKRIKEMEFEVWLSELPEDVKRSSVFYINGTKYLGDIHLARLKDHFEKEIWPQKWEQTKKTIQNVVDRVDLNETTLN